MRWILAAIFSLTLCVSVRADAFIFDGDGRATATVIINIAEAMGDTSPRYSMLWRRLGDDGRFVEYDDESIIEVDTNSRRSFMVRGVPGEFLTVRVRPGTYALDSVYGVVREDGVDYVASGVVEGPGRPTFEVRDGETVYLGIWQIALADGRAVATLWRQDADDVRAFMEHGGGRLRNVALRAPTPREVACQPHPINWRTNRQIC